MYGVHENGGWVVNSAIFMRHFLGWYGVADLEG